MNDRFAYKYLSMERFVSIGTVLIDTLLFSLVVNWNRSLLPLRQKLSKRTVPFDTWAAVPGITGPLCATMESGPRVFFTSYCLLTIVAAMCLNELLRKLPVKVGKAVIALCLIICLAAGIRWVFVCGEIGATTRQRMKAIEQVQQGKTNVLYLDAYRFDRYLWYPDEVNNHAFRLFYHIPDSVEIKIVPIDAE